MPYGLPAAALCGLCKQMEALDTMGGVALAYDFLQDKKTESIFYV